MYKLIGGTVLIASAAAEKTCIKKADVWYCTDPDNPSGNTGQPTVVPAADAGAIAGGIIAGTIIGGILFGGFDNS